MNLTFFFLFLFQTLTSVCPSVLALLFFFFFSHRFWNIRRGERGGGRRCDGFYSHRIRLRACRRAGYLRAAAVCSVAGSLLWLPSPYGTFPSRRPRLISFAQDHAYVHHPSQTHPPASLYTYPSASFSALDPIIDRHASARKKKRRVTDEMRRARQLGSEEILLPEPIDVSAKTLRKIKGM